MKDKIPNKHVRDFLTYYLSLGHAPHYAVLINGPWGIGKTHITKKLLNDITPKIEYVYLSLNGLSSLEEIDAELFKAIYPTLGGKGGKIAGRLVTATMKAFRFDLNLKAEEVFNKFGKHAYVFDDLERFEGPTNAALGYINQFVEHDDAKVIVIANEAEIRESSYRTRREKLIGKTLEVQSELAEALAFFISKIDNPKCAKHLANRKSAISDVYVQSDLNNLRILQQTAWDFERFFKCLSESHLNHDRAMTEVVRIFFAFSFEIRAGRIQAADLRNRTQSIVAGRMPPKSESTAPALSRSQTRYPDIELGTDLFSDEVLDEIFVKGIISEATIRAALDDGPYFSAPAEEPYWRTIYNWDHRTDEHVKAAFDDLDRRIENRDMMPAGEMLHVIGLKLFFAERRPPGKSRSEVALECKLYLDAMFALNRLEAYEFEGRDPLRHGYANAQFYGQDDADFQAIYSHLRSLRLKVRENSYPALAADLLAEMKADPELYLRRVCQTRDNKDHKYLGVPILASIHVDQFVDAILSHSHDGQKTILMAFEIRYQHGELARDLAAEKNWLLAVRGLLLKRAAEMSWISRYRIERKVKHSIDRCFDPSDLLPTV